MWPFNRKKKETQETNVCELKHAMDGAMSIQGNAMTNQTEMNIAYQAYTLYRYKEEFSESASIKLAGELVVMLQKSIFDAKNKLLSQNE